MPDNTQPPTGGPSDGAVPESLSGSKRKIAGATGIMMAGILLSRLLGLVRESIIAHQVGQGMISDAYNGAFLIPDLMFFLIAGGALSGAFIPVFTEYVATGREKDAWRVFSVVGSVMAIVVGAMIVLGEIFTVPLVNWTNWGFNAVPGKAEMTVALTRILLPAQMCFFMGGLMMGTLNARGKFTIPVLGPIIYNLGIIMGGVFASQFSDGFRKIETFCIGAVVGAVVGNLALQWWAVRRSGGYFITDALKKYGKHPGAVKVWKLMIPVILGLALPQVSMIIGKMFASTLGNGPQSALVNANKLMQVPLGVFAQATAIAIFPTMSAQAARRDIPALRESVNYGIRSILFLTVPSSMLMYVLALPIVQLIYQSGKFTYVDAQVTADVLRWFAVGIFAWSAHAVITRGFYALQDSLTPVVVGTGVTLIFIPLNFVSMHFTQGAAHSTNATCGLAAITSLAAAIHMLTMLFLLWRKLHGLQGGRILISLTRIVVASGAATLAASLLYRVLKHRIPVPHAAILGVAPQLVHVRGAALAVLVVCLGLSTVVYLGVALALRMEEVDVLRRLVRRRA